MKKNNGFNLNIFTYGLLFLFITTLLNDYITFFVNINYFFTLLISMCFTSLMAYLLRKKINITLDFHKSDIIFYTVLFLVFLVTFAYPDIAFDSINYHIYLQENPFGDKIFSDFFAGKNLNSFSYAFPDRIHYIFRSILGFRLGTICNYLVLIVLFYQTKEILKKFVKNKNELVISLLSTFSVFSLSIIELIDNYYIDLFSLVALIEIMRMLLIENFFDKENKYNITKTSYLALLFGFAIAIKISNAPMLFLLLGLFFLKTKFSFKKINLKLIISCILCGILPFILYFIYTYIKTGNPVFPFYNTIFKSPYYALSNWMDTRFGPHSLKEVLVWPVKIVLFPGRGVDSAVVESFWMMGYVLSFVYLGYYLVKKIKKQSVEKDKFYFFILVILMNLIWSKFELGYTRYGLPVILLSNICFYIFLIDIYNKKNYFILSILIVFALGNFAYSSYHYLYSNEYWLFNNIFQQDRGTDYIENIKKMFQKEHNLKIKLPDDSVWGIINYNAAYATMLNNGNALVNLNSSVSNEKTENILASHLADKKIFTMTDILNFNNFFTYLNNAGYYINSYYNTYNPSFMRYRERIYVFEIEKNNKKNIYNCINTKFDYTVIEKANSISFITGIEKSLVENVQEKYYLEIKKIHGGKDEILDVLELGTNGELINYKKELDLYPNDHIIITILDENKKSVPEDRWFMLINFTV